jgi:hypothetical protein
VRGLLAVFERSHARAAQFPGDPESQMALGLVCLDSDHGISRTSVLRPALSEKAFDMPWPRSTDVIESQGSQERQWHPSSVGNGKCQRDGTRASLYTDPRLPYFEVTTLDRMLNVISARKVLESSLWTEESKTT